MEPVATVLAQRLKLSMSTVRTLLDDLEGDSIYVRHIPTTTDLCPNCGMHYATAESGFCVKCDTERELERQAERDDDERRRLEAATERRVNRIKKARERLRRRHLANPRDKRGKEILAAVDEFIALMDEDDEFEEEE